MQYKKYHQLAKKFFFSFIACWLLTTHTTAWGQWSGTGTAGNPYQISSSSQLATLASNVNGGNAYAGIYFVLIDNIDLSAYGSWTPIGTSAKPFKGNFDGANHTISGLYINTSINDVGLFGFINSGSISNLGLSTSPEGVKGGNNVGILLGSLNTGTITNCYVSGNVIGNDIVGGMLGNQTGTATISQCFAFVDVTGNANVNGIGGLAGVLRGNLNNSYAWGDVKGTNAVGGLVGTASTNGVTSSCYAMGDATSTSSAKVGGLVGSQTQSTSKVQNSVALNKTLTSRNSAVGRIIGLKNASTLVNNYAIDNMTVTINNGNKTIISDTNGIDGGTQSDAPLKTQSFYSTTVLWSIGAANDNTKTWNIWEGVSLPYLQRQSSPVNNISFSGTTVQGTFCPDVAMDSVSIYVKNGAALTRLGVASVNNTTHTWTYSSPALIMNGSIYVLAHETGKTWPSYPVMHTICGLTPTFDTVDKQLCASGINLQTCISNLQYANMNDVQFSRANGETFDANIISSPTTYAVTGVQTIYARATTSLGCQSIIKSFQISQTGSLLFKESFGSVSGSTTCSSTPLGSEVTTYSFGGDLYTNGHYGICSQLGSYYDGYWYTEEASYDHTNPGTGRALIVNADFEPGKFYTLKINNLCPGQRLYFSAWVFNLVNINAPNTNHYIGQGVVFNDPDLRFELTDADGVLLAQYETGNIPKVTDPVTNWRQYGFSFVTESSSSITLTLYNNAPGGNGNDLMIDDIEVYLCTPPVTITSPSQDETVICENDSITLSGNYADDGTMGSNVTYRWLRSTTGNVNNPLEWTAVYTGNSSSSPINTSYTIPNMTSADDGYYRLIVGALGSIDQNNCTAKSLPIKLTYKPRAIATSLNITGSTTICYGTLANLTATITETTIINPVYKWYNSPTASTPLFTGQAFRTPNLTANTTYYVSVLGDNYCENLESDRHAVAVTVNPIPTASIMGEAVVWSGSEQTYTTQPGMSQYQWNVTGGTIVGGQGTENVTIRWGASGSGTAEVSYIDTFGCTSTLGTANITIQMASLSLSLSDNQLLEGESGVTATLCLPDGLAASVGGLPISLAAVSTVANTEYQLSGTGISSGSLPATITIPEGQRCISFNIAALPDNVLEGTETLTISAGATGFISDTKDLATIDRTPGDIIVQKENDASEPNTNANFRIGFKTSGVYCTREVRVGYTLSGTAIEGEDYTSPLPHIVTIPAGSNSVLLPIMVLNNNIVQGTRTVQVELNSVEIL